MIELYSWTEGQPVCASPGKNALECWVGINREWSVGLKGWAVINEESGWIQLSNNLWTGVAQILLYTYDKHGL